MVQRGKHVEAKETRFISSPALSFSVYMLASIYTRPPIYFALAIIIIFILPPRVPSSESPGTRVTLGYIPLRL